MIANQILKTNLTPHVYSMAPYDGMVVRRKINAGEDLGNWKTHKEEVTRYFMELIEAYNNIEEEFSESSSQENPKPIKKI